MMKFIIPSLIGIFLYMTPVVQDGSMTIPIAMIANDLKDFIGNLMDDLIVTLITITCFTTILHKIFRFKFIRSSHIFSAVLTPSKAGLVILCLGTIFANLVYFNAGPMWLIGENTGGMVFHTLLPVLLTIFFAAGLLLPLLVSFGLIEFCGTMFTKIMRPIFNLPGSSAVNCIASWLGDGSVGVMLTKRQYLSKIYTKREAAVIATSFSAVSITFCLVVISQVKLANYFIPFYLSVTFAGLIAAIIVPKFYPLSKIKDEFIDGEMRIKQPEINEHLLKTALCRALNKVDHLPSYFMIAKGGIKNVVDMIFGVLPSVMAIGTCALIIAEYTKLFTYLGMPFLPIYKLLQIPEADLAIKTVMVGFADMFLPSIIATSIHSEVTRFIVAGTSVCQLIFMSETGALILGSKLPIKLKDLFIIYILRTIVCLPILTIAANIIF